MTPVQRLLRIAVLGFLAVPLLAAVRIVSAVGSGRISVSGCLDAATYARIASRSLATAARSGRCEDDAQAYFAELPVREGGTA